MRRVAVLFIRAAFLLAAASHVAGAQSNNSAPPAPFNWKDALRQKPEWYAGDEAVRVADNLLLYQRDAGGWYKNIDMAAALNGRQKAALVKQKQEDDSTIDNGATYTQLEFLARVYTARRLERHREAFLKGVDYLLKAQYSNGGWPQYYPRLTGYYKHITYNDGAMIGVMILLRDIARHVARDFPPNVIVRATGEEVLFNNASDYMAINELTSFSSTFVIIGAIHALLFMSLKAGILSLIPNVVPILLLYGFMGLVGIPLNTSTAMIATVAIGIAQRTSSGFWNARRPAMPIMRSTEPTTSDRTVHPGLVCRMGSRVLRVCVP